MAQRQPHGGDSAVEAAPGEVPFEHLPWRPWHEREIRTGGVGWLGRHARSAPMVMYQACAQALPLPLNYHMPCQVKEDTEALVMLGANDLPIARAWAAAHGGVSSGIMGCRAWPCPARAFCELPRHGGSDAVQQRGTFMRQPMCVMLPLLTLQAELVTEASVGWAAATLLSRAFSLDMAGDEAVEGGEKNDGLR